MNRLLFFLFFNLFIIFQSIAFSQDQKMKTLEFLDVKGNKVVIDSVGFNQPLIIILFHNYNCIDCLNSLKCVLDSMKRSKQGLEFIVVSRTRESRNIVESFELKKSINKIFGNISVYFDIHQNIDTWPPSNVEDGLFGKYKLNKFPAVVVIYNTKEILLTYDELFPENYTKNTLYHKILKTIKEISY